MSSGTGDGAAVLRGPDEVRGATRSTTAPRPATSARSLRARVGAVARSPHVPFEVRCRLYYWNRRRSWPNSRPETFSQKLLFKMVHDRRPILTTFADKVAVRDYVARTVGAEVLPDLYAVATDPGDLDPDSLPTEFVVKPNNASALVWIVSDRLVPAAASDAAGAPPPGLVTTTRAALDWDLLVETTRTWLTTRYGDELLEWAYLGVPPRILVEEYLADPDGQVPADYKLLVFHGRVRLVEVHSRRFSGHRVDVFTPDWDPVEAELAFRPEGGELERPASLDRMVEVAEALGQDTDFVRVDLYDVAGRVVFGELTSYPAGLTAPRYYPDSLDLGRYWTLPRRYDDTSTLAG